MSVHVCSLIPVDALVIRYGPTKREVLKRHDPELGMTFASQNIFKIELADLLSSKERSLATLKFLDTWAEALTHSHMPEDAKKDELHAVQELQYELLWSWEFESNELDW